jgi:hypothetical protein
MKQQRVIASMMVCGLVGWVGLSSISMAADTETKTIVKVPLAPMEAYTAREKTADAKSAQSLYELANWAAKTYPKNVKVLTRADAALTAALKIDPDHMRSTLLKRQVQGALKLAAGKNGTTGGTTTVTVKHGDVKSVLVSKQDMYWIRLRELKGKQRGMKIEFADRKLLHEYISKMQEQDESWQNPKTSKRFLAFPRIQQVRDIAKNFPDDTTMLKKIQIKGDPSSLLKFRKRIWPLYKKNCASAKCHGGATPKGKLRFVVMPGRDPRVDYTNFVILTGFKSKAGYHLIDRQEPSKSLLLKYAVPRNVSNMKHPVKIDPMFKSVKDTRYINTLKWIKDDLVGPRTPEYHLTYKYPYSKLDMQNIPDMK